ncbi:MAG TPA: glycogen synthase GlgA, partial [Burkholderiales bacterium]|jgi:starch synthase
MNVLFVTPECAPLTKTGGLGDVSAALPAALRATGVDVRTLMPRYSAAMTGVPIARLHLLGSDCQVLEADAMLLLDCPDLYLRDGGPYQTHDGDDWEDNALRFGVLSRAAALLGTPASPLSWQPQVVHCHDWPTALAPAYLHFEERRAATVMTIHNLAFQGNFDAALLEPLGLPRSSFHMDGVEFHGRLSLLKAGIAYADAVTTVSPSYAREIQGEALGCGLDGLLRRRREALTGIANGIDVETWNPATDPRIAQPYDAQSLEAKAANKAALQQRMGLRQDEDLPLLGMVSRLTQQKGADLVAAAAGELAAMPVQLALLGKGQRALEEALREVAVRHPGRIAVHIGFDEDLAHLIEAGADMFLMPSRFEPCGLNQMYSQRYGTPPVARATGGLIDTIVDGSTGFLFEGADAEALVAAVRRAAAAYGDAARWARIQRAGMSRDFSWGAAARRYADLYARLATPPPR